MSVHIVIGKCFGDESKGLVTDCIARQAAATGKRCVAVRHNGGAQAGHTVDRPNDRFVFHQLSAASLQGGATFWASPFLPDLYKLSEETADFEQMYGFLPTIYAHGDCRCVVIDDVLLNMALETSRGDRRHGSCGMGINEAVERSRQKAFCLPLKEVAAHSAESLYHELRRIRWAYVPQRMEELSLSWQVMGEYGELLQNDNVLYNAAKGMQRSLSCLTLTDDTVLQRFDEVIFEGAQGLLLDACYERYAPHLTSSRTGIGYPLALAHAVCPEQAVRAIYVTRSYVTRHGRGPLPYEADFPHDRYRITDRTNQPNPWQEHLRLAVHGTSEDFLASIREDIAGVKAPSLYLAVTHLNETEGHLLTVNGTLPLKVWSQVYCPETLFEGLYLSYHAAERVLLRYR